MKHTLMFVDDEVNILNSLVRLFRNEGYEIFTATSGAEGLKIVEENEISLIISDYKMPHMSGVDFLARVKEVSPDTVRIMLTGYADLGASIDAINKGEVYRFITKPWKDEEIQVTVSQSLEFRDLKLTNRNLTKTVKKQAGVLKKLENHYPGISEVSRSEDGSIVIDEDSLDDESLDEIIKNTL
ncbi:MAG: response regulator [Deltaproteobacteria bacterium]|nr:response regulator [Deltaproteobacteria bacterium]